jgi:2-(1,2-epoxy-1,2-dihydrophenyl)acetyl-CoA isomerase
VSGTEVLLDIAGGVATVTLHRPERLNALDKAMSVRLLAVLEEVAADDVVRAVVLTGAGRAFSAGGDRHEEIAESAMGLGSATERAGRLRAVMRSTEVLRAMPKVAIAAINGPCFGAGLSLACAADIRVTVSSARFGTAFVTAALPGDYGGTWLLPQLVGDAMARDLYLLAEPIDAPTAHRIGLVSRCYEPGEFAGAVTALAERVTALPPTAVRLAKANLNDAAGIGLAEAMDREAIRTVECIDSPDAEQARTAFRQRSDRR